MKIKNTITRRTIITKPNFKEVVRKLDLENPLEEKEKITFWEAFKCRYKAGRFLNYGFWYSLYWAYTRTWKYTGEGKKRKGNQ